MVTLKLTTVGASTGVVIPEEMLTRLKLGQGDALLAIEKLQGHRLTPYDPEVEEELKISREFIGDYRKTFQTLAK